MSNFRMNIENVEWRNGIEMMDYINSRGTILPNENERNKISFKDYMDLTETKVKRDLEMFIGIGIFIGIIVILINYNNYE